MNKENSKELNCCEVLNLSKIQEKCPQVIRECELCEGTTIVDDLVPEEFIVDYSDRQIYSATHFCAKCGAEVCEKCIITIDGAWEQIDICKNCYEKYKTQIDKIIKLQNRAEAITEEIADKIEEFLNGN